MPELQEEEELRVVRVPPARPRRLRAAAGRKDNRPLLLIRSAISSRLRFRAQPPLRSPRQVQQEGRNLLLLLLLRARLLQEGVGL